MVLLSLGTDFHPMGSSILVKALRDKDDRLRPYALEVLRGMDPKAVTEIATPDLVGELIEKTSQTKHPLVRERTLEVLALMLPSVGAKDRGDWTRWWTSQAKTYQPVQWEPPPAVVKDTRTTANVFVERAFDLRDAGLDVAIVIDSTGSMQPVIDTACAAIGDVVTLLSNLAPKLRLGLVEYKDMEELGKGAQLLAPLTKDAKDVHDRLERLVASGGGDIPERVEKGVEVALSEDMHWNKDANRLILVIGDAPPHPEDEKALLEMVKRAHDAPFEKVTKAPAPRTGRPRSAQEEEVRLRPFITSTICTNDQAKKSFDEIAKAGGGSSVLLEIDPDAALAKPGKKNDEAAAATNPGARKVVEHIMLLSFGQEYRAQVEAFVRIFFEYLDAKK
jgi:hypothetical protein